MKGKKYKFRLINILILFILFIPVMFFTYHKSKEYSYEFLTQGSRDFAGEIIKGTVITQEIPYQINDLGVSFQFSTYGHNVLGNVSIHAIGKTSGFIYIDEIISGHDFKNNDFFDFIFPKNKPHENEMLIINFTADSAPSKGLTLLTTDDDSIPQHSLIINGVEVQRDLVTKKIVPASSNDLFQAYFIITIILFLFLLFSILLLPEDILSKIKFSLLKRINNGFYLVILGWCFAIFITYLPIISGEYSLSQSNMMYNFSPWNSFNIKTKGPLLSDSIDSALPYIYETYYGTGYKPWNSQIGFGMPVGIEVLINPFNWFYLLPLKIAIILKSFFKLSIAYFGLCWFLRQLKLRWEAVAAGSISFAFSSAMIMWHFWPHTDVMCVAPLAIGLSKKLIVKPNLKYTPMLGGIIYLLLVAEMPTWGAYILYLVGFYVLFGTIARYKNNIGSIIQVYFKFIVSVLLGVISSMPYLSTLFESVVKNGYADSRVGQAKNALESSYLRTILLPYYRDGLVLHPNECTLFFGMFAVSLLLFTFIGIRRKKNYYWPVVLVITLLFAYSHILDPVFIYLPAINTSLKIRVICVCALSACIVAAINFNDILENRLEYKKDLKTCFPLLLNLCLCVYLRSFDILWAKFNILFILIINLSFIIMIVENKKLITNFCALILIVLTAFNMGHFSGQYLPQIDSKADIIPPATDTIRFIQDNINDERFLSLGDWTLFSNSNIFYNIRSMTSHSFINTNADVRSFRLEIDDNSYASPTFTRGTKVKNTNLLRYAGVKFVVKQTGTQAVTGGSKLVYSGDDGLSVYEISNTARRFYLSSFVMPMDTSENILENMKINYSPGQVYVLKDDIHIASSHELTYNDNIEIIKSEDDRALLQVESSENRILVFNDYHAKNWKAKIDEKDTNIIIVNYLFNGIEISSGKHMVEIY